MFITFFPFNYTLKSQCARGNEPKTKRNKLKLIKLSGWTALQLAQRKHVDVVHSSIIIEYNE